GERGLAMLTLRSTSDSGAYYMPEFQEALRDGLASLGRPASKRRSVTFDLSVALGEADDDWHDVVADDDGLRVAVARLDGGAALECKVGGGGAFVVVVDGSVETAEGSQPAGSVGWADAGEV